MPRKSRIDAPGALHHIIARGIERSKIFRDKADRDLYSPTDQVEITLMIEGLGKALSITYSNH